MPFAVVGATSAGMVSASAAALAEKFLRSRLMGRTMFAAVAALVATGIIAVGALAPEPQGARKPVASDAKQELLELMHAWGKALVQSDVGLMDRLLAYETVCTDPGGGVWNKAQYLEFVRTDFWHIESYELKDTKVAVYGDAAVVTGLLLTNTHSNRRSSAVERYTKTWIRRHGTWQCVAWQTMVLPGSEHVSGAELPAGPASTKPGADSGPQRRQY
jgi:hypothetical protein